MKVINDNASIYLDDTKQFLKQLTENREYEKDQIEELEQGNADLEELLVKVKEVRNKLEREIKANSDLYKNM